MNVCDDDGSCEARIAAENTELISAPQTTEEWETNNTDSSWSRCVTKTTEVVWKRCRGANYVSWIAIGRFGLGMADF